MNETQKETNGIHFENVQLNATKPAKARMGDLIVPPQVALHALHSENVKLQATTPAKARMGNLIMGPQVALHAQKTKQRGDER